MDYQNAKQLARITLVSHPLKAAQSRTIFSLASLALDSNDPLASIFIACLDDFLEHAISCQAVSLGLEAKIVAWHSLMKIQETARNSNKIKESIAALLNYQYQISKSLDKIQGGSEAQFDTINQILQIQLQILKGSWLATYIDEETKNIFTSIGPLCQSFIKRWGNQASFIRTNLQIAQLLYRISISTKKEPQARTDTCFDLGMAFIAAFDHLIPKGNIEYLLMAENCFKACIAVEHGDFEKEFMKIAKQDWYSQLDVEVANYQQKVLFAIKKPTGLGGAKSKPDKILPVKKYGKIAASSGPPKPSPPPLKEAKTGSKVTSPTKDSKASPPKKTTPAAKETKPITKAKDPKEATKDLKPSFEEANSKEPAGEPVKVGTASDSFPPQYKPRYGLAQVLSKRSTLKIEPSHEFDEELQKLYREIIVIKPILHDPYIELGSILTERKEFEEVIKLYSSFPFPSQSASDDLFLYQEISRILIVKLKNYKHPLLQESLVAEGLAFGLKSISNYTEVLDKTGTESNLLKIVFARVNKKKIDDVGFSYL